MNRAKLITDIKLNINGLTDINLRYVLSVTLGLLEHQQRHTNNTKKCEHCNKDLVTGNYGFYCCNPKCKLFDIDIMAYEVKE